MKMILILVCLNTLIIGAWGRELYYGPPLKLDPVYHYFQKVLTEVRSSIFPLAHASGRALI